MYNPITTPYSSFYTLTESADIGYLPQTLYDIIVASDYMVGT